MTAAPERTSFYSRQERFARVGSTNDVVRGWLADGTPEVCLAVADEQAAGRGRGDRRWTAPAGRALLLSLGFRPDWLPAERAWRIPATVALAMADAAEEAAGLPDRAIRLKWPNDLVVETEGPNALLGAETDADRARERLARPVELRKLGGVLAEADGIGSGEPRLVVGIGLNADWPAAEFPADLAPTMSSLREASGDRPVDLVRLLDAFLLRLEPRVVALRSGWFDVSDWVERQATTGRVVRVEMPTGDPIVAPALGVDALSGGLVLADPDAPGGEQTLVVGEVTRVRLAGEAV
jgi:BirA family biotin operon repressor/biotin-[acetyl-CoA-carboxylase] ligase